jgi:hypothetical protein
MGDMHGTTFHASRTDRDARRAAGPRLTFVRGTGDTRRPPSTVVRHAHPASPDFAPDAVPGTGPRNGVHDSEPESSTDRRMSRGSTSPDSDGPAHSGSGPHVPATAAFRRSAIDRVPAVGRSVPSPVGAWVHLVR